jgi:phosphate transport system substrate-binding protein
MNQRVLGWFIGLLVLVCTAACTRTSDSNARGEGPCGKKESSSICVVGAGDDPGHGLYARWASEYGKQVPGVHIRHDLVDVETAVRRLGAGTADFVTTSQPLEPRAAAARGLQHLPLTLGAVAIIYHEAGIGAGLRLSSKALALVLSGRAARWNDPVVADANPDKRLPMNAIVVVPVKAGSLADESVRQYLSRFASGGKQTPDVRGRRPEPAEDPENDARAVRQVQSTPWSVAFVDLSYADVEGVAVAAVANRAGRYVSPTSGALAAVVKGVDLPDSLITSPFDAPGLEAYPLSFFSYFLVPNEARDRARGEAVLRFLWWASHDGQAIAQPMHGAVLPVRVVAALEGRLKELKAGGRQVLAGP